VVEVWKLDRVQQNKILKFFFAMSATISLSKTSTSFYSEQLRNSFFVFHCFRKRVSLYSFCDSLECHEWSAGAHIRTLWAVRHAATFAMNTALVGKQLASPKRRGMYQAVTCNNPLTARMRLDSTRSILFARVFFPEGRELRFLLKKRDTVNIFFYSFVIWLLHH